LRYRAPVNAVFGDQRVGLNMGVMLRLAPTPLGVPPTCKLLYLNF